MGEGGVRYWVVKGGWAGVAGEVQKGLSGGCLFIVCSVFVVYIQGEA
jgi:hypothetical protein